MYRVRFHLARGRHYRKWQVRNTVTGKTRYYVPESVTLTLGSCKLVNQVKAATGIYNGAVKSVCSWIECQSVKAEKQNGMRVAGERLRYNPRLSPHWNNECGDNLDGLNFDVLKTWGREVVNEREAQTTGPVPGHNLSRERH